ncbi:sigma 54-interacting transcriptional regulator [Proteinivorax hydrogeniformans]|uniref:Sigma 54-interacting transcriptional regulator n=1 Tax=Proteinivorax hydrogeniformans TaxID=1826727 RepID=A0AAU8HU67_9FIRM
MDTKLFAKYVPYTITSAKGDVIYSSPAIEQVSTKYNQSTYAYQLPEGKVLTIYTSEGIDDVIKHNIKQILDSINEGIHIVNAQGETIFYNPMMAEMEGIGAHEVLNKKVLAMFPSLTPETSTIHKVLKSKEAMYDQLQSYTNYKGRGITTINSTFPLYNSDEFVGVLEVSKNITRLKELSEKVIDLQQKLYPSNGSKKKKKRWYTFDDIVGEEKSFKETIEHAKKAAGSNSHVLIYGETGTGKELFAQSIHSESSRKTKPFIAQNCAALPEGLLEGILFGTVRGSFTGATDRPGLFEQANGGTLLLDELNSMGFDLQAKLLRVLQDGKIRPVGATKEIDVDVRIIATTNGDPHQSILEKKIREDLYYRLAVVNIEIPPLRHRKKDIPVLTQHFLQKYQQKFGLTNLHIESDVEETLLHYGWPGNVRELEHIIEGAVNLIDEDNTIKTIHLPKFLQGSWSTLQQSTLPKQVADFEKNIISQAYYACNRNISKTAQKLGVSRQSLQYKIKKYGV